MPKAGRGGRGALSAKRAASKATAPKPHNFDKTKEYNVRFRTTGNIYGKLQVVGDVKTDRYGRETVAVRVNGTPYRAALAGKDKLWLLKSGGGMVLPRYGFISADDEA